MKKSLLFPVLTIFALSLFFLALGMGVPLIIMGTGGGHLLPRAGGWMEEIKRFFGITMLGIAIWLLDRIIADSLAPVVNQAFNARCYFHKCAKISNAGNNSFPYLANFYIL